MRRVSVIGSGNVGTHLALALNQSGLKIGQIWSRNRDHAVELAEKVGAFVVDELKSLEDADLILLTVKDDALVEVIRQLPPLKGLVAHTSGAVSLEVYQKSPFQGGVLYPLQTFSKSRELDFRQVPLCVEHEDKSQLPLLKEWATLLSDKVYEVDSAQRKVLHLAAVFACNFPNHLYQIAARLLENQGMDFDLIRPLITETAAKVQQASPQMVQTGPAIRGDLQTMNKHEEMLQNDSSLVTLYRLLSERIKNGE